MSKKNAGRNSGRRAERRLYLAFKRCADVVLSLLLLALLALPLLVIALVVRLDSRGSAVFRQIRLGRGQTPFVCLKFRTMDAEGIVTRAGGFLRRSSLDELPQLWNVVRGDMSLVGYRPVVPEETGLIAYRAAGGVYALRPGITGLAQISGRDLLDAETKAALDRQYTETVSFRTDLAILLRTVGCVWNRTGVREKCEASEGKNGEKGTKIL